MQSTARYAAPPRRKEESKFYPGTIRMPRETHRLISTYALEHNSTIQGFIAEAIDDKLQKLRIGKFLPDDWEE